MFGIFGRRGDAAPDYAPRISDALAETGPYRTDYGAWRPVSLPGDPALVSDAPRAAADAVSAALIGSAPERAAPVRALLANHGVPRLTDAFDWEMAENALVRMAERSEEPGHAAVGPVLRPRYLAFLVDAGCAYALALVAARPGAALAPASAALSSFSRTGPVWPVIRVPGQTHVLRPFETMMEMGTNAILEGWSDVLPRAFAPPPARGRADDMQLWFEEFVQDEGRPPTPDEVAASMVDLGLQPADLPPALLHRLGITG